MSGRVRGILRRHGRVLLALLVVTIYALVIVADGKILRATGSALSDMRWKLLPAALFLEISSMAAFARAQRRLLRAGGLDLHLESVLAVTFAGNAISLSLPIAGTEVGTAYTFRQFRQRGASSALAAFALVVSGVVSTATFTLVVAGGAIASGNPGAALLGVAGAVGALAALAGLLLAIRHEPSRRVITRGAALVSGFLARCGLRPARTWDAKLGAFLESASDISVRTRHYVLVFVFLLWNWVGDCLCLAIAIRATGSPVPWRSLFVAYGAAYAAATIQLTPGSVGVVEVALAAALTVAGLHGSQALAAVLIYRLVSFWLVVTAGWAVVAVLRSRRNKVKETGETGAAPP